MGTKLHNSVEFDSVPTPTWFLSLFKDWHDPYPLGKFEVGMWFCEHMLEMD